VPAALGLCLVAPALVSRVFGAEFGGGAAPLRMLALALVPMFMNAVLLHALIAGGQARVLPRLTAVRLTLAVALAAALVPALGATGGAAGFVLSEVALMLAAARACAAHGAPVSVAGLLGAAACASVPMTAAVLLAEQGPVAAAAMGVATYLATLGTALWLSPRLRRLSGGAQVGYP
jgi:O-antigen/teichoic acid export membrane protein